MTQCLSLADDSWGSKPMISSIFSREIWHDDSLRHVLCAELISHSLRLPAPRWESIKVPKSVGAGVLRKFGADFFCVFFWLPSSRQMECSNRFFAQIFGAQIFAPIFAPIFGAQIFAPIFAQIFGAQIFVPIFAPIFAPIFRRFFFDVLALEK